LLLVGIPVLVGFEESAKNRFLGVLICVLVAGAHYVLVFISNSMGDTGVLHPALAGWLPVMITGPSGVCLFESMLT
ncbi:MAG: LptF/LptG family permease, partial [Planctomycetota bacterium]